MSHKYENIAYHETRLALNTLNAYHDGLDGFKSFSYLWLKLKNALYIFV